MKNFTSLMKIIKECTVHVFKVYNIKDLYCKLWFKDLYCSVSNKTNFNLSTLASCGSPNNTCACKPASWRPTRSFMGYSSAWKILEKRKNNASDVALLDIISC